MYHTQQILAVRHNHNLVLLCPQSQQLYLIVLVAALAVLVLVVCRAVFSPVDTGP